MFLKELVKSEDTNLINNFLIEASRQPDNKDLKKINFLIKDASKSVLEKIKLNLIYFLGEFGKVQKLDTIYLQFLVTSYYNSDRWIRNEILETFNKLSKENELSDEIKLKTELRKNREKLLQTLTEEVADPESGEMIYPAPKTETETIRVTLK